MRASSTSARHQAGECYIGLRREQGLQPGELRAGRVLQGAVPIGRLSFGGGEGNVELAVTA